MRGCRTILAAGIATVVCGAPADAPAGRACRAVPMRQVKLRHTPVLQFVLDTNLINMAPIAEVDIIATIDRLDCNERQRDDLAETMASGVSAVTTSRLVPPRDTVARSPSIDSILAGTARHISMAPYRTANAWPVGFPIASRIVGESITTAQLG